MSIKRIIFAGTPDFAEMALRELIASSYSIVAVYTQPDRPKGRGLKLIPSPVKTLALQQHLPVYQPASLKIQEEQEKLAALKPDAIVVAAYGLILPKAVLSIPTFGCINIHPSILPRFRGAAPIPRTIEAGDSETGVTIMQMDEGLDTGPILYQTFYTIKPHETSASLHDELASIGAKVLVKTLDDLQEGTVFPRAQSGAASYANKITKEEAHLSFDQDAEVIERKVRAFNPKPIAYVFWQGEPLRIWKAEALLQKSQALPGTLTAASTEGLDIACGKHLLRILIVQLPGGKPLAVRDFFHAQQKKLIVGCLFA